MIYFTKIKCNKNWNELNITKTLINIAKHIPQKIYSNNKAKN